MTKDASIKAIAVPPKDALDFWQSKVSVSAAEYDSLSTEAATRAFFVSGLAKGDLLDAVRKSLGKAIEDGTPFAQWKKEILPQLENAGWVGATHRRLDNIFRTNMQGAYMAGRYTQMRKAVKLRPFWQYSAVNDDRTRPSHAALHGVVYPADSAFWDTYYPPNGHRCRCNVVSLSERQVEERGLKVETDVDDLREHEDFGLVNTRPQPGFDRNVGKDWWAGMKDLPDAQKHPEAFALIQNKGAMPSQMPASNAPSSTEYAKLAKQVEKTVQLHLPQGLSAKISIIDCPDMMKTSCDGHIIISSSAFDIHGYGKFTPAKELFEAWHSIKQEKPLSLGQELALSGLWHEILHHQQKNAGSLAGQALTVAETLNEWVARRTYQNLLAELGAKPLYQAQIIKDGLGYKDALHNYDALLHKLKVHDKATSQNILEMFNTTDSARYGENVVKWLKKESSFRDEGVLQQLVEGVGLEQEDYAMALDMLL